MAMSEEQKQRAAQYVLRALKKAGRDPTWLVVTTRADRQTVTDFLDGARWPQKATRQRIEDALELTHGTLELAARGAVGADPAEDMDPVEAAIRKSPLGRGNQNKLVGIYFDMLDSETERGTA